MRRAPRDRGIERRVVCADNTLVRLLLLAATALLGGGNPTVSGSTVTGSVTANSGASITVSSHDRSLTCAVLGEKGQQAILRWGTGARATMSCRRVDDRLVLAKLVRLGSNEPRRPEPPATTGATTRTEPTRTEPAHTEPTRTTPPPPTVQPTRTTRGVVAVLTGDGVGVSPDGGGELVRCAVTPAPESRAARAGLALGLHVTITCRLDGGRFILSAVA